MKKSFFIILVLLMLCNTSLFAYSGKMQKAINALASLEHGNNATPEEQKRIVDMFQEIIIAEAINNISNSISSLLEKRQNMSAQQNRRMQNTRTKTPENISLSEQDEKNGRNPELEKQYAMDVKHYNDWRKLLLQMYIGEVPYDNTRRIKMQSNMRELREKYDGHRLLEWKPCHLETWDGERDH